MSSWGLPWEPIRRRSPNQRYLNLGGTSLLRNLDPHEHHSNDWLGCPPAVGRCGPPPGTREDTRRAHGFHIEQELYGNCTQTEPGRCSEVGGRVRSGLSRWSSGYPHPLDDDHDDQVIGPIDWRKTQNTTLLRALGSICSATAQLPHATILSDGLERCGDIAIASGGFTDTWRGWYRTKNVALKAFRTYPIQDLREAEKVRHGSW
jgi:hypothetical protein